jgi:hypothetical protein
MMKKPKKTIAWAFDCKRLQSVCKEWKKEKMRKKKQSQFNSTQRPNIPNYISFTT